MQVDIVAIDVRRDLQSGSTGTFLTFLLPDQSQVSAEVAADVAQYIIELSEPRAEDVEPRVEIEHTSVHTSTLPEVDVPLVAGAPETVEDIFSTAPEEAEEQMVAWQTLGDDQISPEMRAILLRAGIPDVIPAADLVELIDAITRQRANPPQPSPPAPAAPVVGKVQHLQPARRKTVAKDEWGYPIVPRQQTDRDPGEVAVMGSDEDGVPQA